MYVAGVHFTHLVKSTVAGATLGDISFSSYSEPKTCITQRIVVVIEIQLWRNNPL